MAETRPVRPVLPAMSNSFTRVRQALAERAVLALSAERAAAVALVLREHKNGPEVLIIERAQAVGDPWSGHLAFPGGRRDPSDPSLRHTAVRETREELGLDLSVHAEPLGDLDPLLAGSLLVAPFVFALGATPNEHVFAPDPREVQRQFWVPLTPLLRGEQRTFFDLEREGTTLQLPGYQIADRVLWGMSYRMLESLLSLLPRSGAEP